MTNFDRGFVLSLSLVWLFFSGSLSYAAATNPHPDPDAAGGFKVLDYRELSRMELRAQDARHLYWKGQYPEAARVFEELASRRHGSTALYLNEASLANAAAGDFQTAGKELLSATSFLATTTNSIGEKRAVSKFGREVEKMYYGDPYERAMEYLLLALFHLDQGDWDNALAACKSGLLADSESMQNRYQSDFALLYLLEAKCHLLRNEPDEADLAFKAARDAYRVSHPRVREFVSERLSYMEALGLSKEERRAFKLPEDDAGLNASIINCDERLQVAAAAIQPEEGLRALLTGEYNTLVVIPEGCAPTKWRGGVEANVVYFRSHRAEAQPAFVFVDGRPPASAPGDVSLADIEFQAVTRGGRYMDSILAGKVMYKHGVLVLGQTFFQAGVQAGGWGGLAFALAGAAIEGVGAAVSPEADTRCWNTLPAELVVYGLKLSEGPHEIAINRFVYFEKASAFKRKFSISPERPLTVIYGPPTMMERYSSEVLSGAMLHQAASGQSNVTATACGPLLLPPALGLGRFEKFPSPDQKRLPRGFAPDPVRCARIVQKRLAGLGLQSAQLDHGEAIEQQIKATNHAAIALQVELTGLDMKVNGSAEDYFADFTFSLVRVADGEPVFRKLVRGDDHKQSKDKVDCTGAFYRCFEGALTLFSGAPEFKLCLDAAAKREPAH